MIDALPSSDLRKAGRISKFWVSIICKIYEMQTKDIRSRGRSMKTFRKTIREDMKYLKLTEDLAQTLHNGVLVLPTLLNEMKLNSTFLMENLIRIVLIPSNAATISQKCSKHRQKWKS